MPPKNNNNNNTSWWPGNRNQPPEVPGLNELVELLTLMGSAPAGTRPQLNPDLIEVIRGSPLLPVIKALQPIYKKLVSMAETEQAGPATPKQEAQPPPPPTPKATTTPPPADVAPQQQSHAAPSLDVSGIEAGMTSLSSKLDFVSQAVSDVTKQKDMAGSFQTLENNLRQADSETRDAVKAAANASKTQFETVDTKVSQMSGKLDPALTELTQGIKKLQVGLLGDVKTERTRLETKVNDLEKEVKELQQVIDATKAELLPVEVASKIALQGTFSDELDKTSSRAGSGNTAGNVVQTAKRVRTNTLGLISKCRALFTFINRDPETGTNGSDLGTEGEWGRCAEHLRASNSRLRDAIEEKEQSTQRLQFVGFVVDQLRKGNYTEKEWKKDANGKKFAALIEKSPDGFASIQLLAQDLSRITATTMTVPVVPTPSVIQAVPATPITTTPITPATVTATTNTPADNTTPVETKTRGGKTSAARGAPVRGNPPTTESNPVTAPSTGAASKGPTPLTAPAVSKISAAATPSTPLPTPPATAALTSPAGVKPTTTRGNPTAAQSTAASNGTSSFPAPAGSKLSAARTTTATPKTPVAPLKSVAPAPPRSPSPVTAPSSPVVATVPVPEKQDLDVGPAPAKKSSSYFRTKSGFARTPAPLSGWGPLVG